MCHAWNFFALFYYPAVFVACRPKCKIDHLIHCHCGGSICETKKNCMSDFFSYCASPPVIRGGISQSVCHRRWSLYHIRCIFGILLVQFLTGTMPIGNPCYLLGTLSKKLGSWFLFILKAAKSRKEFLFLYLLVDTFFVNFKWIFNLKLH